MRWSLRLSKFDFVIENKPGTRIRHAEALRIHVGFALEEGHTSKKKLLQNKAKIISVTLKN